MKLKILIFYVFKDKKFFSRGLYNKETTVRGSYREGIIK